MAEKSRPLTALGAFVVAAALAAGVVRADPVDIVSSTADYEPRLEQPTTSGIFQLNNIDDLNSVDAALGADNIDTPTDAVTLRVGGQSRHKMNGAFFFLLPQSAGVQGIRAAHFKLTQVGIAGPPTTNADLWAVGVYNNISVDNDFDTPKVHPTIANGTDVNNGLAGQLYLEADAETNIAGMNTSVPRRKVADNFLTPAEALGAGATPTLRETNAAADTALGAYLTELYASTTIGPDTYLVLRLNPDGAVSSTATNQYRFSSADEPLLANRPTLTLDVVVPEPASASLLGVAAATLLARRRRRA